MMMMWNDEKELTPWLWMVGRKQIEAFSVGFSRIFGNGIIVVWETMPLIGDQAFSCLKIHGGGTQGQ